MCVSTYVCIYCKIHSGLLLVRIRAWTIRQASARQPAFEGHKKCLQVSGSHRCPGVGGPIPPPPAPPPPTHTHAPGLLYGLHVWGRGGAGGRQRRTRHPGAITKRRPARRARRASGVLGAAGDVRPRQGEARGACPREYVYQICVSKRSTLPPPETLSTAKVSWNRAPEGRGFTLYGLR